MIGYHITNGLIADSDGHTFCDCSGLDTLDIFLDEQYRKDTNIFYDLDANVASLLRIIEFTEAEGRKLLDRGRIYIAPYTIKYFPGKLLCIDRGFGAKHPYVYIYDASQYKGSRFKPDCNKLEAIELAKEARDTGLEVAETLESLELPSYKLTSPVSAFLNSNELDIPTIDDIPEKAGELAYQCIKGNWLEAFSYGYWDKAYDYDLNGAYGSELAKLVDIRQGEGEWINSREIPEGAIYGFAKGQLTTWANFHPFLVKGKDNISYTPIGTWEDYVTLQELRFMRKYKVGSFDIKDGWWWVADQEPNPVLADIVMELYKQRANSSNELKRNIIRRILAGIWGKTIEFRREEFGKYFNPVYGAVVETNTRLKVAATCIEHRVQPLTIAVDGFVTDHELNLPTSRELGEWRLSHTGRCIVVNAGTVAFEGKECKEEFSLKFSWLYNQIKEKPEAGEYSMEKYTTVTLAQALNSEFDKLGKLEKTTRTVYIEPDYKRLWKHRVSSGGELLNTQMRGCPLEYSIVKYGDIGEW